MRKKYILSAFLCACVAGNTFAGSVELEGEGTVASPYVIATVEQLSSLREFLGEGYSDTHFAIVSDIDLRGVAWEPVGSESSPFFGKLHGKGHVIKNLSVTSEGNCVGFFSVTGDDAVIDSLGFVNCSVKGVDNVGTIAGISSGSISHCYATGAVTGTDGVGGLVGVNGGPLSDSYSLVCVAGGENAGGIAGKASSQTEEPDVAFTNLYSAGAVTGDASCGAFVGLYNREDIYKSCYFDSQSSGLSNGAGSYASWISGLTSKKTNDMYKQTTFTSGFSGKWDFDSVWNIWDGNSYPYLNWQSAPASVSSYISAEGVTGRCNPEGFERLDICDASGVVLATVSSLAEDGAWQAELEGLKKGDVLSLFSYSAGKSQSYPETTKVAFVSGWGTESSPFAISMADELASIRGSLGSEGNGAYFELLSDIVLDCEWTPIGNQQLAFYGHFDGNGHCISNLEINQSNTYNVGLFGQIGIGASVRNLHIIGASVTGKYYVGILAGQNKGTIEHCSVYGTLAGSSYVGGIAGQNYGTIEACYAAGKVDCSSTSSGGVVGDMMQQYVDGKPVAPLLLNSYSNCMVGGNVNVGGLLGNIMHGSVAASYSAGTVSEGNGSSSGALIGNNSSNDIGFYNDTEYPLYADSSLCKLNAIGSNRGFDALVELKSPVELMTQSTFENWDFETVWQMSEGNTAPYLSYQSRPAEILQATTLEVNGNMLDSSRETLADSLIVFDSGFRSLAKAVPDADGLWSAPLADMSVGDTVFVVTYEKGFAPSMIVPAVLEEAAPEEVYTITMKATGNEDVSYLINLSIPSLKQVTPYNSSAKEDVIVTVPKSATDAYFSWNRTVPMNYTFRDFLVNGQSIYDVSAETGGQLYYIKGDVELELVFFETEYFVLTYDEPEGGEIIIEVYDYFDMNIGDYTARPYETGEPIATGTKYRVTFYADEEYALTGAYVNDEKVFEAPVTDEAAEFENQLQNGDRIDQFCGRCICRTCTDVCLQCGRYVDTQLHGQERGRGSGRTCTRSLHCQRPESGGWKMIID